MNGSRPLLVYSPNYDIRFHGVEALHPFDGRKYSRAWELIRQSMMQNLVHRFVPVDREASEKEIALVHPSIYLNRIRNPLYLARALEFPPAVLFPQFLRDRIILAPMRWATRGTIKAAQHALVEGAAINLGGGYHHASATEGGGFCIYSDIAIAVFDLRARGSISQQERVLIVDLDAHQGNGLARIFLHDERVVFVDIYNRDAYPKDKIAQVRADIAVGLASGAKDSEYMNALGNALDSLRQHERSFCIAFYNAGTDIVKGDPLGRMNVTQEGVLARDLLVMEFLDRMAIPWVMLTGGGYTRVSHQLIASSVLSMLNRGVPGSPFRR